MSEEKQHSERMFGLLHCLLRFGPSRGFAFGEKTFLCFRVDLRANLQCLDRQGKTVGGQNGKEGTDCNHEPGLHRCGTTTSPEKHRCLFQARGEKMDSRDGREVFPDAEGHCKTTLCLGFFLRPPEGGDGVQPTHPA